MILIVCRIYAMRTCKLETLLQQQISNIKRLYENNIVWQHMETILLDNLQRSNPDSQTCRNRFRAEHATNV